ncbi:hypothetical protein [uncultured Draconibacterium sp.]|uniref:hypothetical protein n=1 Tax=uncultured Draconibacterium sp. TaxID=1573823 RepID=UPI0029C79818|nr:hypothetical protein [uncultured Draconibacterium sp.]
MTDSEFISCFPGHKEKIKILLAQDENFREVAEDYMLCKKTLEKLKRTNKGSLAQQYFETLEELKLELFESITK